MAASRLHLAAVSVNSGTVNSGTASPIWLREGDGDPVVLLPGFCGDHREIVPLAAHLDGPVLAFDLGGTPLVTGMQLRATLAGLGIERFHLVAASFGALSSGGLAPSSVLSFAPIGMLPSREFVGSGPRWMSRLAAGIPDAALESWYRRRLRRSLTDDGVDAQLVNEIADTPRSAELLRARLRAIAAWEVPRLHHVPTLWIQGTDDPFVRWTDADILAACPWASIARVPGRHRPHASDPEATSTVLSSFWADVRK